MASSINASTSGAGGLITTADNTGILNLQTASTNAVTIDASQNVGIGTNWTGVSNSPLGVYATAPTTGISASFIANTTNGNFISLVQPTINSWGIGMPAGSSALTFVGNKYVGNAGTEYMRITSGGCLTIGATAPVIGTEIFSVNPTAAGWGFSIYASGSASNGMYVKYSTSPNSAGSEFFYFTDSTTVRAYMRSNGGLSNYSANNTNLSDERLKTDILPATTYLDKICSIPVVTFKYKDQTDEELNLGVIAQDVDKVAPELVDHSGFGETPEGESPYLSVYQTDLQYALMKCIQEQQTLIVSQSELINNLTARIEALEAK